TADETRELVSSLLSAESTDPEAEAVVPERVGGNPFFAEEMVRRLEERGRREAAALPDTVQALLAARPDSLEPFERRLVQHASVVGGAFWGGYREALRGHPGAP